MLKICIQAITLPTAPFWGPYIFKGRVPNQAKERKKNERSLGVVSSLEPPVLKLTN
ncbi:hypothetical protein Plhal304r1_c055g0141011 [Plasmopara halstedii]